MRYFLNYNDDTMKPKRSHNSGELVGRHPLAAKFKGVKLPDSVYRRAIGTRMAKAFLRKMDGKS